MCVSRRTGAKLGGESSGEPPLGALALPPVGLPASELALQAPTPSSRPQNAAAAQADSSALVIVGSRAVGERVEKNPADVVF
jgi:hypothetical protein